MHDFCRGGESTREVRGSALPPCTDPWRGGRKKGGREQRGRASWGMKGTFMVNSMAMTLEPWLGTTLLLCGPQEPTSPA